VIGGGSFPTNLYWNDIIINDCIIEGSHDAIQCFGQGGGPTTTGELGRVEIMNCILNSAHQSLTMKGNMVMISKSNIIRVDSRGIEPYLTNVGPFKCAGFHMNVNQSVGPSGRPNSLFMSSHDTVFVTVVDNLGGGTSDPDDDVVAGYLIYDLREASPSQGDHVMSRCEIVSPAVVVEYSPSLSTSPASLVAGVAVIGTNLYCSADGLMVSGGSIRVQQNADGFTRQMVCVWMSAMGLRWRRSLGHESWWIVPIHRWRSGRWAPSATRMPFKR
jgi:hypothetical protein